MKTIRNIFSALKSSFQLIQEANLYYLFAFPIAISLLTIAGAYYTISSIAELTINSFNAWILELKWSEWLVAFIEFTIGFMLRSALWLLLIYFFKYIIIVVLSPVLSFVAQITQAKMSKEESPFSVIQMFKDIGRAIIINSKNALFQLLIIVLLALLGSIPLIGLISIPLLFITEAYFLGFSLMDYGLEAKGTKSKETFYWIRRNKWATIVIGTIFFLFMLIPILGWMVGPIICVMTATIYVIKHKQDEQR